MYIYKFLNINKEVIYVGRAKNIVYRFSSHHHLNNNCYNEINEIHYSILSNDDESAIYERYYINKLNPKYNTQYKNNSKFRFTLPDLKWNIYEGKYPTKISLTGKPFLYTKISKDDYLKEVYKNKIKIIGFCNDGSIIKFNSQIEVGEYFGFTRSRANMIINISNNGVFNKNDKVYIFKTSDKINKKTIIKWKKIIEKFKQNKENN